MLKSKLATAAAALAMSLGAIGSAQAGPISISSGDFIFNITNFDSGTTGYSAGTPTCSTVAGCDAAAGSPAPGSLGSFNPSADTMGVFSVLNITNLAGNVVYWSSGPGSYLTGVFGGLQDYHVDSGCIGSTCMTSTKAVGGTWALYQNTTDYDPSQGPLVKPGLDLNDLKYPGITGGTLFLSGVFSAGVLAGDTTTTYQSTYNNASISGVGAGYLDITGGSAMGTYTAGSGVIDKNNVKHDLYLTTGFDSLNVTNGWTVTSTGQIKGNVPEPGTMALAGLALLGAGLASRRRKS